MPRTKSDGFVLSPDLRQLSDELAEVYLRGELVMIAGAGVSRASGMPGWGEMVASIQSATADDEPGGLAAADLEAVLSALHGADPIQRADSLQRLTTKREFHKRLHQSLYGGVEHEAYRPSVVHWHLASFADRRLMPDIYTSNYDDLLEDAKQALPRSGRIRHFHGRLPQSWSGETGLYDPPVVTSRDYAAAAESAARYQSITEAVQNKTALLVGFSLSDPNIARVIHEHAQDCRAAVVASPGDLTPEQQGLRLGLLRRYWQGLKIQVWAIEAHEELPAFLLTIRRNVLRRRGKSPAALADRALRASVTASPWTWSGARHWVATFKRATRAAKTVAPSLAGDRSLRAGFYAMGENGFLAHLVSSATTQTSHQWPRRELKGDDELPWGAAGYSWAAGVPIASVSSGGAFDRNVPEPSLLEWQKQRVDQGRLPALSVLCVPAFVRFDRTLVAAGVLYFSSRRSRAFDSGDETKALRRVLEIAFETMIAQNRVIEGGMP
jgi:hypothetical protein